MGLSEKEFELLRKKFLLKMKFTDATIKDIKESSEYKEKTAYNKGIMDCVNELSQYFKENNDLAQQNRRKI